MGTAVFDFPFFVINFVREFAGYYFSRSFALLNNIKGGVGAEAFFSCVWEAALGSPSVRLPALIFVNACFDKRKTMEDQIFIMGDHVDHMVRMYSEISYVCLVLSLEKNIEE